MDYLKTLYDKDVFPDKTFSQVADWKTRKTITVILLNSDGKIALVTNPIHRCFMLPGGGIEDGEDVYTAADRECQEEAACIIEPIKMLGVTEEYRARDGKRYETYGVLAKVKQMITKDLRTEMEKENGLTVGWYTLEEAEKLFQRQSELLKEGKIDFYNTGFNIVRDYIFLKQAN